MLLLLERNADVNIRNGEGRTAREVCQDDEAAKLLWAAEKTESKQKEELLLTAARDGSLETLSNMVVTILNANLPSGIFIIIIQYTKFYASTIL